MSGWGIFGVRSILTEWTNVQPQTPDSLGDNPQPSSNPPQVETSQTPPSGAFSAAEQPVVPPRKSNKKLLIVVGISLAVLLLIGAVVGTLINRNNPALNSQAITLTNYKSSSLGFELKVPQSWRTSVDDRPKDASLLVSFRPTTQAKELISILCKQSSKNLVRDDLYRAVEKGVIPDIVKRLGSVSDQKKTQIGPYPAYRFVDSQIDISSDRLSRKTIFYHAYYLVSSKESCSLYVAATKTNDMDKTALETKVDEIIDSFRRL